MTDAYRGEFKEIQHPDEIPEFESEAEEADFWATHGLGEGFFDAVEPIDDELLPTQRMTTRPVVVRLKSDANDRLRELASRQRVSQEELARQFVEERLEEELRREELAG